MSRERIQVRRGERASWLLISPLVLILGLFLVLPILTIVMVSFWDYNRDGLLDAFVGNFLAFDPDYLSPTTPELMPHPSEYQGQASMMYRQEKDGSFSEVTEELGLLYPESMCMGLTVFDYDSDGDLDVLLSGDGDPRVFWLEQTSPGAFVQHVLETGLSQAGGCKVVDLDGDGANELVVTGYETNAVYVYVRD